MLLARERWNSFWRSLGRPVGVPGGSPLESLAKASRRVPRMPRLVTALLLLVAAGMLVHPEMRISLRTVASSYSGAEWEPSRWSSVNKLRKEAETNRDPQLLSLLSLLSNDDAERIRLSEEAIQKDPTLTWLDYEQSLLPLNDLSQQHYLTPERIERLRRWDPENAVPLLLEAEIISRPLRYESFLALIRNGNQSGWEKQAKENQEWLTAMQAAFSAATYDNYYPRLLQLVSNVSKKYDVQDPDVTLFVLFKQRMVNFESLRVYRDILLARARAAEQQADLNGAFSNYWGVLRFSERMSQGQRSTIEHLFAQDLGAKAGEKLQVLLNKTNHADEAALVGFQLAEGHTADQKFMRDPPIRYSVWQSFTWTAVVIQAASLMILLFGIAALISLSTVWVRRKRGVDARSRLDVFFSLMADWSPLVLAISCAVLFFTYHPYAQTYKSFLSGQPRLNDLENLIAASSVLRIVPEGIQRLDLGAYLFWLAVNVALFGTAAFLLLRMLRNRRASVAGNISG